MADNVDLNAGSGGPKCAADELTIGGVLVQVQRVKLGHGADGVYAGDVSTANGLPVNLVTLPTLTKGTQGATGTTVQALKDAGRVNVAITCYQGTGIITTEALFAAATFSKSADGAAATTGVQFSVTAGKRFRVQSLVVSAKKTAASASTGKLALRYDAANGTISNTSPILAVLDIGSNNATANNYIGPFSVPIPDGTELLAASSFGLTNLVDAVTFLWTITLTGYEY